MKRRSGHVSRPANTVQEPGQSIAMSEIALMIVDAHSHVFPRIHGQNGAGPTRGTGYGRAIIGGEEVQVTHADG